LPSNPRTPPNAQERPRTPPFLLNYKLPIAIYQLPIPPRPQTACRFSLSLGERAGVRGKAPSKVQKSYPIAFPSTHPLIHPSIHPLLTSTHPLIQIPLANGPSRPAPSPS